MSNNFPPRVTVQNSDIEITRRFLVANIISVDDFDPDSEVVRYFFRDNNATQSSGFFVFKGVRMAANVWFKVEAHELNQLFYNAGMIPSAETIGVMAYDGTFWSEAAFGLIRTVPLNDQRPIVTLQNVVVVADEKVRFSDFVSYSDPNGDPVQFYRIVDRSTNANGGYFEVNGVQQESGKFFDVAANNFHNVFYVSARVGQVENIGIFASDGRYLSQLTEGMAITRGNIHNPVIQAIDGSVHTGKTISLSSLFSFSDGDGNTLKRIRVLDTGAAPHTGYFTFNGTKIDANDFRWFEASDIPNIRYHGGTQSSLETFRLQAFDGTRLSTIASGTITTIAKPTLVFDPVMRLDDFEFARFIDFAQVTGLPSFRYEVIDLNDDPISASLVLNGNQMQSGVVHTIQGNNIENLYVRGGSSSDGGRLFDQFLFRSFNGVWSDWKRLDVDTTELAGGSVQNLGKWLKTNFTFNFPNQLPAHHVGGLGDANFQPMNAAQRNAVREIYRHVESITPLRFTEVSGSATADMNVFTAALPDGVLGVGYPPSNLPNAVAGDFIITNTFPGADSPLAGNLFYEVIIHEIGHTLGLKHPDGVGPAPFLPPTLVDSRYTVMTSVANQPSGSSGNVYNRTYQLFDVMGLQAMYGANTNYNPGDTQIRGDFVNDSRFMSIWDSGGYDTINRTQDTIGAVIDLRQGRYSSVGGEPLNMVINYGVEIEAARGGSGSDILIGNELDNRLFGNGGNDTLRGHGGLDALFGGAGNDVYQWGVGDDFNIINEQNSGGIDVIEAISYAGLNHFTEDIVFRRDGNDLIINFSLNYGPSQGGFRIKDQGTAGSRIETFRMVDLAGEQMGPSVDLTSVWLNATSVNRRFMVTSTVGAFGNIALPV
ncbi:MAG TPA: M10 family metallopeptidase C-terminal domain-containing protein [Pirellulaceae bacterium]|nr:M10 family metallopeptidase C-terminal domain-containing protein [Pirellulaceae bacterium]HMO91901.1 M10 family metallopeptidase C-terminal domain-containing protein [Pirellulaceae bacterium]HMP68701.1 M10 family metallopeptidase C-terminal domain-containing protein [Pirellulaceae bacterium]